MSEMKLPNGVITKDPELYANKWEELGWAVCRVLGGGAQLLGFDPDVGVMTGEGARIDFSPAMAREIVRRSSPGRQGGGRL